MFFTILGRPGAGTNPGSIIQKLLIHWRPVAYVDNDGKIIRKLTEKEQQEWIKNEINKQKGLNR